MRRAFILFSLLFALLFNNSHAQTAMANVYGRRSQLLNGDWEIVVDPFDVGMGWRAIYKDAKATGKADFVEYSFEPSNTLRVPGDFNSQKPELTYFESSVWYKKIFDCEAGKQERLFLNFGGANYITDVWLNDKKLGRHEGGFTPFGFEVTGLLKARDNALLVRVNSARVKNGVPGSLFDWFNYGGITRDVHLVKTKQIFAEDYKIQLDPNDPSRISGYVQLKGARLGKQIALDIPELKVKEKLQSDANGYAIISLKKKLELWSPEHPKLYEVKLSVEGDTVSDEIGFRSIKVEGTKILLNGKPVFLRGVNIHEEIPQRRGRAYSDSDARQLINWAKDLGCNFIRLVHYPHNEYTIRYAARQGLLVWEEVPLYQGIEFADTAVKPKAELMLKELIKRDQNRCNVILWSIANETSPSKERDRILIELAREVKLLDPTRLVTAAFYNVSRKENELTLRDTVMKYVDVVGVNEYLGWYTDWPGDPEQIQWKSDFGKPMIISEFGGESVYNNKLDTAVKASAWSEEYVANIYRRQIKMFANISFLAGVSPWVLADFRSPYRMQTTYQQGWNRKGLLSDKGEKKKAWFVLKEYYERLREGY